MVDLQHTNHFVAVPLECSCAESVSCSGKKHAVYFGSMYGFRAVIQAGAFAA